MSESTLVLPKRYYPLRDIAAQMPYANSAARFNVVPAGRRSGKTERFKRKLVRRALSLEGIRHDDTPRFFAGAPTRDQAKRIFWDDLKAMTQPWWQGRPSETELTIRLVTGSEIVVVGLDKPQRIEGTPWDGGGLDEYGNMKPQAWGENVRPALSDRGGWCDLIGVPEGRNHYYDLYTQALAEMQERGAKSEWAAFTWKSADVLPAEEIAAAQRDLDPLTFEQEYEASFVNFQGRAYYAFSDKNKGAVHSRYNPKQPLLLMLDFNVAPGVAAIGQELPLPAPANTIGTAIIGEVWIPANSNTPAVCRKILTDWAGHQGRIEVYGDATGGAPGSAKVEGSDWDLVRQHLRHGSNGVAGFGDRVSFNVPAANPAERARVNAVNTRCQSRDSTIRLMVDPKHAPHVVKDFEGVRVLEGGSGELDKHFDKKLTHISDAIGYYVVAKFPTTERAAWGSSNYKR
jgi:hypothetical protein